MIIDATDMVAGRLGSNVAKRLLKGEEIAVVNAEKAIISGDPYYTVDFYTQKIQRGDPYHGPFYPKMPDRMLKRIIRGMLPMKTARGRKAFSRLQVYISMPHGLKGQKAELIKAKRPDKCISLSELSQRLGVRKLW